MTRTGKAVSLIAGVVLLDQIIKFWIKLNFVMGEELAISPWFILHFTENNGMAFGFELGGRWGKIALSVFRILAITGLGVYISRLLKNQAPAASVWAFSLIFAGALGNMIDSAFYGLIFSESYGGAARLFPSDGGYAGLLEGRVVDMFYFPIFQGFLPDWVPFKGGDYFVFLRPVFNLADTAISAGVGVMIAFQKTIFPSAKKDS